MVAPLGEDHMGPPDPLQTIVTMLPLAIGRSLDSGMAISVVPTLAVSSSLAVNQIEILFDNVMGYKYSKYIKHITLFSFSAFILYIAR